MGFEDIPQPEQNQEKLKLREKIQAFITQGASVDRLAELLGAEQFLTREQGRGKSGAAISFKVEDFIQWTVDSAKHQNYQLQLPDHFVSLEETILPPDAGEIRMRSGAGFEQAGYIPRTRYLMDLLTEMKLQYAVADGTNTPEMMRKLSYKAFLLPQLGKMVLVCDEEGNATYLVNNVLGERNWQQFIQYKKSQLRDLADQGAAAVVSYQGDKEVWKQQISVWLTAEAVAPIEMPGAGKISPPKGWMTALEIGKRLGKTDNWVKNRFSAFPIDTGKFGGISYGSEQFYISLKEESELISEKDPQLLSGSEIVHSAGTTWHIWEVWITDYLKTHPTEQPVSRLKPNGNKVPHYLPEIGVQFRDYVQARKMNMAPNDWLTLSGLAKFLDCSEPYVESRVKLLQESQPDQVKKYFHGTRNTKRTFYSPTLRDQMKKIIQTEREIPENYITLEQLATMNGLTLAQVSMRLFNVLKQNPLLELEKKKSYKKGKLYISPKLVQSILSYLEK
ncbi:MAG: hypothetical protein KBB77_01020 [Candidatus Moranbacteria bacterium]|nr:hypothetical protein [Candidatus Moranbacteria bacterium]